MKTSDKSKVQSTTAGKSIRPQRHYSTLSVMLLTRTSMPSHAEHFGKWRKEGRGGERVKGSKFEICAFLGPETSVRNYHYMPLYTSEEDRNHPHRGGGLKSTRCHLQRSVRHDLTSIYSHAPHNDVSVDDRPRIRRWSLKIKILQYNIIILTIVLQLPTVFSTVTCCTGL